MSIVKRIKRHLANVTMRQAAWSAFQDGYVDIAIEIERLADLAMRNPQAFRETVTAHAYMVPPGLKVPA